MTEFDDLENEERKIEFLTDLLKPIADKTGARVLHVSKDDEVRCIGKFEKRPFQFIMSTGTGGLNVEIKLNNTVGIMQIIYDPEAEPSEEIADPDWERREEHRYFIAPGYYLEGYPEELADSKNVLKNIDPAEVGLITALMQRLGVGWVNANDTFLSCGLFESLFDPEEIFDLMKSLHRYASQFEKDGPPVAPSPSLLPGDVAEDAELIAATQFCPFCKSRVTVGKDWKCPNCGGAI